MKLLIPAFKQILIISPEPWDGHFVSKHHYAEILSKTGSQVYFLNPPDSKLNNINILNTKYPNLFEIRSPQVAKGLRFYPCFLKNRVEKKWLKLLENLIGSRFTTIWLFENSRFYDMRFADERLKIYHQVDLNQNFHEKIAAQTADLTLCTTEIIRKELKPFSESTYKLHHAVAQYETNIQLSKVQKVCFSERMINAAYIGNLNMGYLDVVLLTEVVQSFPNVLFHFIGTCTKKELLYMNCKELANVKWWGRVDSDVIPSILKRVDVLLLTYQMKHYNDQASPHKVMEYLASGKVTVATYTDEYKDKRYLLEMVDDNKNYISKFDDVIQNLSDYNSTEKQLQRKQFAQENTYDKQLNKISAYLHQHNLTQ